MPSLDWRGNGDTMSLARSGWAKSAQRPTDAAVVRETTLRIAVLVGVFAAALGTGCGPSGDKQTYYPVALGMVSGDPPLYGDGETEIYQVSRPVSLPIISPLDRDRALLAGINVLPYGRTPWITKNDVKVQISWTVSNLEKRAHNVEILIDPWNEFVRYVPGVSVGEDETVPDLSGIDLLIRVEGMSRKTGTFTFDDMDELATDLATVQNIVVTGATTGSSATALNGLVNHAFEIHNRSSDNDRLIQAYVPPIVAGLVGFDLGLRARESGTLAIEILVEVTDVVGNRVDPNAPLKIDGSMWMRPDADLTAPAGQAP
jgi:hypothetical protein